LPPGYAFVRELGRGSSGRVMLAHQASVDRLVAIKTINADVRDAAAASRLRREGQVIAALRHPNVVSVYELVIARAQVALVMEYVPGGDLRGAIDGRNLTGSHAVRVLAQVAAALDYAGQRGVVHRDVKPANVLLGADGQAKLADFGLARLPRSSDGFRTFAGAVAGTPIYMAPEQILDPDVESPAIDAYAFAVLAYEVLTGGRPFAASELAPLVYAHLHEAPIPPWRVAPELPVPVGEILLAGLSKSPTTRPTPAQLAERLNATSPQQWDTFFRSPRAMTGRSSPSTGPGATTAVGSLDVDRANPRDGSGHRGSSVPRPRRIGRRQRRAFTRLLGVLVGVAIGVLIVVAIRH
jgi:serine/threonine protein kinase